MLTPIVLRINKVSSPTTFKEYATKIDGCEDVSSSCDDGSPRYLPIIGSMLVSLSIKFGT